MNDEVAHSGAWGIAAIMIVMLAAAGLIPLLRADYVPQKIKSAPWKIMVMTPGRNPLNNLTVVLREAFADTLEYLDDDALLEGLQFTLEDGLAELLSLPTGTLRHMNL